MAMIAAPAETTPASALAVPPSAPLTIVSTGGGSSPARRAFSRGGFFAAGLAALRTAVASAAETRNGSAAPLASDRDKIAHLLRRAGFGYSQDDLNTFVGMGLDGTLNSLLNYDQVQDTVDDQSSAFKLTL